ncbi:MAG: alpha/beta hydrolase [Spirochaetaceae bacterium]|nr:MAG: alpha/beta hydrolase [Spirochaetaceae bacterium]
MKKGVVQWLLMFALVAVIVPGAAYVRDMKQAYARVQGASRSVSSPFGEIEYTHGGAGIPVLVIHGGGGGFDQGQILAQAVLGEEFHWVTPSRFGYLGSAMPEGATWDEQAHAYAHLLDHLGLERVAVLALSQGGASAFLFAVLYPERVSSLSCLSCGAAHSTEELQAEADQKGKMLAAIFSYDLPYWAVSKAFRQQFMGLMGADKDVVASLTPGQLEIVTQVIDYMNPVAPRAAGATFDNQARLPGERVADITAPVLIVHAKDDTLQLYHNAEFAAANIPGAELLSFETGGHLLMAIEQDPIRNAVQDFISSHASPAGSAP